MGGRSAIAHGLKDSRPPEDLPYVPDVFILREGDRFWSVERISGKETDVGQIGFDHMLSEGAVTALDEPVPWEDGRWAAVEEAGLSFFDKSGEDGWKSERARSLVEEARAMKGEPERALALLRASGALVNVPVPGLVGHLERERREPGESLYDIYSRLKRGSERAK